MVKSRAETEIKLAQQATMARSDIFNENETDAEIVRAASLLDELTTLLVV